MLRRRSKVPETCDILVVCTANICRSPMAASMLAHGLPHLRIASAGTYALKGEPPHELTRIVLEERGVPVLEDRARQVTPAIARGAGLIITMTRDQRAKVVTDMGAEAFTVHELARLVEPEDRGTPAEIAAFASARLRASRLDVDDRDVSDPIGLPLEAYERCFVDLADGLRRLAAALTSRS